MSKTMDEWHKRMLDTMDDSYEKTVGFPLYDLTRAGAYIASALESSLEESYKHLDASNLSGEELNRFTYQHKGISRKEANKSIGKLLITGTCDIQYGDLFETANGVQFYADGNYSIVESGEIGIKAVVPGSSGNVGANYINLMPVTIAGIVSVTNPQQTYDGYDEETDEALYARYLYALQTPISSGSKAHYKQWALECVGVGNAKVEPLENGPNTVSVYIVDSDMLPANEELLERVQEYIDPGISGEGRGEAPMGAYCTIKSAIQNLITISASISLLPDYSKEVCHENIRTEVDSYLKSINFTSDAVVVSYAKIGQCILNAEGVADYQNLLVNGSNENITLDKFESAVAEITYV